MANILIIDDNAIMRKNIWFMLRREKHTIFEAEDGPVGIAIARKEKIDLVLLDFMLPYMSGEQVARYLYDHDDLNHIPVIMLTAMNQSDLVFNLLKLNVRAYLLKPVKAETLKERVKAVLGGSTPAAPKPIAHETETQALAETEVVPAAQSEE